MIAYRSSIAEASRQAFALLRDRCEHVCFAESLTGGLIAASFVENPGASDVLNESYVTYSPEAKQRILGVSPETVEHEGVVSERCAREMAEGALRISSADWGVSATGLAGPDGGTEATPVGTVFIGVAGYDKTWVRECHFSGDRLSVREQAVIEAFTLLMEAIMSRCN